MVEIAFQVPTMHCFGFFFVKLIVSQTVCKTQAILKTVSVFGLQDYQIRNHPIILHPKLIVVRHGYKPATKLIIWRPDESVPREKTPDKVDLLGSNVKHII
jgi:hypothetical protein